MEAQRGSGEEKKPAAVKITPAELHLHLLDAEMAEDAVSSYRRREAAWISLLTHAIIVALLLLLPRLTPSRPVIVPREKQDTIFLPLPSDEQKLKTPPKTNIVSDKDRQAQSRTPSVDKDTLRKLLEATRRPGAPHPTTPPSPPPSMQQNPATAQGAPPPQVQPTPPPAQTTAQLEAPKPSEQKKSPFAIASPGASVSQAIQSVAQGHGTTGTQYSSSGDYGSVVHPRGDRREGMEILSDTMGVDFGSYMKRVHNAVQFHWDPLIPESAMPPVMKTGVVMVEFTIHKNGKIDGMKLVSSSGDVSLDDAAWGALTYSSPLPNLPKEFAGDFIQIRAIFYYNPEKAGMR